MFCFSWDNKQTKSKRYALVLIISRPNQNILLQFWKQADQIKLVRFVPEPMGQNGNELLLIQKNSDQTKTFCFRSDLKRTKSTRFAFVPIISFDIGAFLLSFWYRWHYYSLHITLRLKLFSTHSWSLTTKINYSCGFDNNILEKVKNHKYGL